MDVGSSIPGLPKEHRVEHNSQDIIVKVQNVESVSKVNNQWNKGKQIILDQVQKVDRSLVLHEDKNKNDVGKVDLRHVDMDCGNIVAFNTDIRSSDRALLRV